MQDWKPALGAWLEDGQIHFRVWAPERNQVEVLLQRPGQPPSIRLLTKQRDGTFIGIHPDARTGDLYRYRIDGNNTYPDPASRFQPEGVHGPSQVVDAHTFQWTDSGWRGFTADQLIIYELHVGTFTSQGTFEGVIQHLPDLVQLGITAIELMPLGDFPGLRNWGYDGVCPFAPARCYGIPDDLRRLVDVAHARGIAVLLDVVYNHLGPDGNYTGIFSPYYFTDRHQTAWGQAIDLDGPHSAAVREYFIQNALHWIHEYHLDGLRLDATHALVDASRHHFLAELNARVQESVCDRSVHLIAEDNRNLISLIKPASEGGMGLTAVWSDDFHHQIRRLIAGDRDGYYMDFSDQVDDLIQTANQGWFYTGQHAPFFKRPRGTDPEGMSLDRFVFFIQNHDQVGNRAWGDRLHHRIDMAVYRAVSALLLCLPQLPLLFMGQEWASSSPFLYFTDHEKELGRAVTEGRRKEFAAFESFSENGEVPDPQAPDTFRKSKLHWAERVNEPHASMWRYYQALIRWRRHAFKLNILPEGSTAAVSESTVQVVRSYPDGGRDLIIIELAKARRISMPAGSSWDIVLHSEDSAFCPDPMPPVVRLAAEAPMVEFARPGAIILRKRS